MTCFGCFQNRRRYVTKNNETSLKEGRGGIEMSIYSAFPYYADALALFRLKYLPTTAKRPDRAKPRAPNMSAF